jgi:hypothetical protein
MIDYPNINEAFNGFARNLWRISGHRRKVRDILKMPLEAGYV